MAAPMVTGEERDNVDEETDEAETWRMFSVVSYALVIIFVGIPLWWKTTEVHRVSLPYDQLHSLRHLRTNLTIYVTVIVFDVDTASTLELAALANNKLKSQHSELDSLDIAFQWNVRPPIEDEWQIFNASSSLNELDDRLNSLTTARSSFGGIDVVLLPVECSFLSGVDFYAGRHRLLFTRFQKSKTLETINEVLLKLVNPSALNSLYDSNLRRKREMLDRTSMRRLQSSLEVDVTFTLVLPEASLVNIKWDIQQVFQDYLEPFKQKIDKVVKLNFKSQVFFLTFLDIRAHFNAERKHYVLTAERLPHIVTPVEAKLGSYVSMNPSLNFVVYIPMENQSPLQVYGENGEPSRYNSFLIPRWGGFVINNVDRNDVASGNVTVDMPHAFGVFLAQLRILLGVSTDSSAIVSANYDRTHLHSWEVDNLMRTRTVENLANTASTLNSLAQLLEQISNIVISDHVGEQIYRSVNAVVDGCQAMQLGHLRTAFEHSKEAFSTSETAFFDPSMLSLLYFPEDQKYAVYMPLFLPVSVPLFLSLISFAKWLKKKKLKNEFKRPKID